ncbi:extracellular solute-binding protein [Natranaeroarchaeum aerophilus]|uniref:Extracellular solute-binding protein n=1 Tax=Natranaeroarchaeum aerophilus TaxID=2917711 RepID=A0AAE3FMW1_9EURY|nr:extracellular solute-binding protein [Natranaeroarchaeum aerophilus]MCL9812477.1 extracellular solute-binding protein [Natranaeroarchaeum aerophilus]
MVENDPTTDRKLSGVSRRRFLQATGAAGAAMGVAGCLGDDFDGIEISADDQIADVEDVIQESLWDAGLDEDIEIRILPGDFETDSRLADYQSALDAGRGSPDIFMMDSGWAMPFIIREQVLNLENELSDDTLDYVKNDYLPATVDTASDPETGDLHGLPFFPDYPMMNYRKDLVEEAGYDPEGEDWSTTPMSWQEFAEVVEDVWEYHGGPDGDYDYGFTTQAQAYEGLSCCTFNETMTSFGGAYFGDHENLFGPTGDRPVTVDDEPMYETIRMMRSFMYGPDADDAHPDYPQISNSDLVEFGEEEARGPFTGGNAIFMRNWPYIIPIHADEGEGEIGTMPLPYGVEEGESEYEGAGGPSHALGGWMLTVNPNSDATDDAVQVLEAFANESVMLTVFEEQGNLPPDPEVLANADPDAVGAMGPHLDTLAFVGENSVPRPVTDLWPEQSSLIYQEVHDAYTGEKTPEDAMADLQGQLEDSEQ